MTEPLPAKRLAALSAALLLSACNGSLPGGIERAAAAPQSAAQRPNVLVILADDLGYSDLGVYGSEIRTPNLDSLAAEGGIFTNFHSTPLCSPTRANLLTGADHHIVGVGALIQTTLPYQTGDGYGGFNSKARTIAEILQDAGYHTYQAGKWHVSAKGPQDWGFEHSFSLHPEAGAANNFAPHGEGNSADTPWFEDGQQVSVPQDFFSSDAYADKLIGYIERRRGDGRPFFGYVAFQGVHFPLQAPDEYLDRYKGVYDVGYDVIRDARIARQKQLGIIAQDFEDHPGMPITAISPSSPAFLLNVPWNLLSAKAKQEQARQMEVYAAMLENLDANVGRIIDYLKATGQYDNTMIVFLSDNGPDGNGGLQPSGETDNSLENYGRPGSFVVQSVGWTLASSAPFRGFKASTYEGGTSVPAIIRLPGTVRTSAPIGGLASALDIVPTILAATGVADPGVNYKGRVVAPLEGFSLVNALHDPNDPIRGPNDVLADEMYNHRYVVKGKYKLEHTAFLLYGWSYLADHGWRLFDIGGDRGENQVLAARSVYTPTVGVPGNTYNPVVDDLVAEWDAYVKRTGLTLPTGQ